MYIYIIDRADNFPCHWFIAIFSRKTPVLKSFFNKIPGLCMHATFFTKEGTQPTLVFSCECCDISKNHYFEEHLRTAASLDPIDTYLNATSLRLL